MNRPNGPESKEQLEPLVRMVEQEVHRLTSRLPANAYERDELISCALMGLCEARARFRAECGVPLTAFARIRVRGALLDAMRGPLGLVKRRHYEHLRGMEDSVGGGLQSNVRALKYAAMDSYLSNRDTPTPEEQVLSDESARLVRVALGKLDYQERALLQDLFGFTGNEMSGEQLAQRDGCHRSSICRQKKRALAKLRHFLDESVHRESDCRRPSVARTLRSRRPSRRFR